MCDGAKSKCSSSCCLRDEDDEEADDMGGVASDSDESEVGRCTTRLVVEQELQNESSFVFDDSEVRQLFVEVENLIDLVLNFQLTKKFKKKHQQLRCVCKVFLYKLKIVVVEKLYHVMIRFDQFVLGI